MQTRKQLDAQSEKIAKTEAENESLKDTVKHQQDQLAKQQDQLEVIMQRLAAMNQ